MKKDKTYTFTSTDNGNFDTNDFIYKDNLMLCKSELRKYFDIPNTVNNLFVTLSKKATKNSYKITKTFTNSFSSKDDYIQLINSKGKTEKIECYHEAIDLIKAYGLPCYVNMEYDDES